MFEMPCHEIYIGNIYLNANLYMNAFSSCKAKAKGYVKIFAWISK